MRPSGVVAANALSQLGVRTIVVEREQDVFHRARAVTVDGPTMRLFQSLGLDVALKVDMDVTPDLRWRTYSGLEFLRVKPTGGEWGHEGSYMIDPPAVETTLRRGMQAVSDAVDVRFGVKFVSLEQTEHVDLTVKDVRTETSPTYRARDVIDAEISAGGPSGSCSPSGRTASARSWISRSPSKALCWER